MRAEKQLLTKEYATRLNASPFFIVVGYQGLKVAPSDRTAQTPRQGGRGNSRREKFHLPHRGQGSRRGGIERLARRPDGGRHRAEGHFRRGQGVKNFAAEFDKLKVKFGYLNNQRLEESAISRPGGFAEPRRAARQVAGPAGRPGDEAGDFDQHARRRSWRRLSRQNPKKLNKQFSI